MAKGQSRSVLRLLVRLIGPVLLAIVIFRLDDKQALWAAVARAPVLTLVVVALINVPVIHFKILRWRALLAERGYTYSLKQSYAAVYSSAYLAIVTPGRVGDALRVQYVKHDLGTPYAEGLAVSLMDRFCDLYVLAGFVAIGVAHFASSMSPEVRYVTWITVAVATLMPLALLLPGPVEIFSRLLSRITSKWQAPVDVLLATLRALVKKGILVGVPLTIAAYLATYSQGYILARALELDLSFVDVASLLAVTSLLSLMPVSVSGVGVREAFLSVVFPTLGISAALGVAYGVMVFAVIYLTAAAAGFVAWQVAPPPFGTDDIVPKV